MVPRHWIFDQSKQGTDIDRKAAGKVMPAVTFDGAAVERTKSPEIPQGPLRQNADLQTTRENNH